MQQAGRNRFLSWAPELTYLCTSAVMVYQGSLSELTVTVEGGKLRKATVCVGDIRTAEVVDRNLEEIC